MPVVDIHTHVYPPSYMNLLRSRTSVPYVRTFPPDTGSRLIILPGEDSASAPSTSRGRPIGPDYYDISRKLAFMDRHGIDISVISLANPWLDFLASEEAGEAARSLNDELEATCAGSGGPGNNNNNNNKNKGRLFAFGVLPLSAGADVVAAEIARLKGLPHMRGVIMGTTGLGRGLDDPALDPIYAALQDHNMLVFLHPHYGLPREVLGPRASSYGHVMPLALGFPLETTIAVTRMLLSGVWDRFRRLNVLLAHSGGTLPFLAGRIESCIDHDSHFQAPIVERRSVWDVLRKNVYLDAVIYSEVGLKTAIDASGADRIMFGTDHPFFPPPNGEGNGEWMSVKTNHQAVNKALHQDKDAADGIIGGNAMRILNLQA
ncbi:MAG: hypothetical protein M1837_003321 [Sclerophora amabilis]|nr:MAG: hypothetical protein M1837_003321 [Sclerophora amabilis]